MVLNYHNVGTRGIPGFPSGKQAELPIMTEVENACIECRLSPTAMSPQEKAAFPQYAISNTGRFLYVRNRIVMCWNMNPQKEVTLDEAGKSIDRPECMNADLVTGIWFFLSRRGIINHGVFKKVGNDHEKHTNVKGKTVCVIGGGISGLACAMHLKYLGFTVKLVEAMERFGGRILTLRSSQDSPELNTCADLGAMIVTGLPGNPINTLSKQFRFELKKIRNECPLYVDGKEINKQTDLKVETVFNKILESVQHVKKSEQLKDRDISLGAVIDKVLQIQRVKCSKTYIDHQKRIEKKYEHIYSLETAMAKDLMKIAEMNHEIQALEKKFEESKVEDKKIMYIYRINKSKVELTDLIHKYKETQKKKKTLEDEAQKLQKNPPPQEFLNYFEYRLLYWHIANLEYANASSIHDLSLKHWDQDDAFEFPGPHYALTQGYDSIIEDLVNHGKKGNDASDSSSKGVEYNWGHKVKKIDMLENKTAVTVLDLNIDCQEQENRDGEQNAREYTEEFDAVVCTVPLGVLKADAIEFNPSLPEYKKLAIERLGFGTLNKIVMHFTDRFWDDRVDMFGNIGPSPNSRGEFYMFWSLNKRDPVLVGMFAGAAAVTAEEVCKELVVKRAVMVLKEIYGYNKVAERKLKRAEVTGWKRNPFVRGAYSYIKVGASGDDYDMLSMPVENDNTGLFFAGEHTMRYYPATVHGAYLSGLREAGRIADKFGKTYYRNNVPEKKDS